MADHSHTLTDAQIKQALEKQIERTVHLGLDLFVLRQLLLDKGLVTEADIAQAHLAVDQQQKEAVAKLYDAMRKDPSGGIQ